MRNRTIALILAAIMVVGLIGFAPKAANAEPESIVLRYEEEGDHIITFQKKLNDKGYYFFEYTGFYGDITRSAVKEFQRNNGLEVDGIAGPATLKSLFGSGYESFADKVNSARNGGGNGGGDDDRVFTLRKGDDSQHVALMQKKLQSKGYFTHTEITTFFGSITQKAVEKFQSAKDLEVDGVAGPATLKKLFGDEYEDFLDGSAYSDRRYSLNTLIPGDEGSEVKRLQKRLDELGYFDNDATGYYGPITMSAVKAFQRNNDLSADGITGPATKAMVYSSEARRKGQGGGGNNNDDDDNNGGGNSGSNGGGSEHIDDPDMSTAEKVVEYAKQFLGTPYVYGANGPDSFDCSGFTKYVYKKYGISLLRSAYDQGYNTDAPKITSASKLKIGDLVFFNTVSDSDLSDHAGIYIGDGQFIHASSSSSGRYVRISTLSSGYYERVFSWGRRVL